MTLLSRLRQNLLGSGRDSPEAYNQSLAQILHSSHLCNRCQKLRLLDYIERPWIFSESVLKNDSIYIALIDTDSLSKSCSLCTQFSAFLRPTWKSVDASRRSFTVKCTYVIGDDQVVAQLFIICHDPLEEVHLFSTKPVATPISQDGRLLPLIHFLRNKELAKRCTGQLHSTGDFNWKQAKKWFDGCKKTIACIATTLDWMA
jgi:hypothetical protein